MAVAHEDEVQPDDRSGGRPIETLRAVPRGVSPQAVTRPSPNRIAERLAGKQAGEHTHRCDITNRRKPPRRTDRRTGEHSHIRPVLADRTGSTSNTFSWAINRNDVGVNKSNSCGIYSLHPGGANVAMADGSVRFLSEATAYETLVEMFSRSEGR